MEIEKSIDCGIIYLGVVPDGPRFIICFVAFDAFCLQLCFDRICNLDCTLLFLCPFSVSNNKKDHLFVNDVDHYEMAFGGRYWARTSDPLHVKQIL